MKSFRRSLGWVFVFAVVALLGAVYVPQMLLERRARDVRHSELLPSGDTSICTLIGSEFHHNVLTHPGSSFEATASIGMDAVGDMAVIDPQTLVAVLSGRTGASGQLMLVTLSLIHI